MPPGQMPPGQEGGAPGQMPPGPEGGGLPLEGSQSPLAAGQQLEMPPEDPRTADIMAIAEKIVAFLDQKSDEERMPFLAQLQKGNPQLYSLVIQMLQDRQGAHMEAQAMPQPEQRPARRGPEAQAV